MTRKTTVVFSVIVLVVGLFILVGCQGKKTTSGLTPAELGKVGASLQLNPDREKEILAKADITREEFKKSVNEVSNDTEMAREYREAFESNL